MSTPKYFNSHAHCFTIDHVPERFFDELLGGKRFLRISNIKSSPILRKFIMIATSGFIRWIVGGFSKTTANQLQRLRGLIKYALEPTQDKLIERLAVAYNNEYRHVLLTMDLEYMGAGDVIEDYPAQLKKLKAIKRSRQQEIFPFVFADPRRLNVSSIAKELLSDNSAPFQGIKLYPALGYFPFDARLKDIYQYALDNDVPILSHCIVGDVYQRDDTYYKLFPVHPITQQSTTPEASFKKPENFQLVFTHPLNFECLLNKEVASKYFGESVDFTNLKICIAHFGGPNEWRLGKKQDAESSTTYKKVYDNDPLDISQPWLGSGSERYNWLRIIKEMIRKYPNVYADISYTLFKQDIYPILKTMLKDETIKYKILYGTDYYVVASELDEPEVIKLMRKHLTEDEIQLISYDNPKRYLSSDLSPIKD